MVWQPCEYIIASNNSKRKRGDVAGKKIDDEPVLDENIFKEPPMNIWDNRRT